MRKAIDVPVLWTWPLEGPVKGRVGVLPTKPSKGGTVEAMFVTHLVTDWPLETHVFVSLLTHKQVYVGTKVGIWRVDGDRIR